MVMVVVEYEVEWGSSARTFLSPSLIQRGLDPPTTNAEVGPVPRPAERPKSLDAPPPCTTRRVELDETIPTRVDIVMARSVVMYLLVLFRPLLVMMSISSLTIYRLLG